MEKRLENSLEDWFTDVGLQGFGHGQGVLLGCRIWDGVRTCNRDSM